MSTNELTTKIREYRELQALIDEATQEAETIKDAIKAHMGNAEEIRAGEYKVTWKSVKAARLDSKALKESMPDVYQQYTKTTTSRRFCVA